MEDITFPRIDWLADWRRVGVQAIAQRQYVSQELARLAEEGAPVLFAALRAPLQVQTELALSILSSDSPIGSVVQLRLRPGAKPPKLDPQGRSLPASKAGQLCAKLGTLGGRVNGQILGGADLEPYTGTGMQNAVALRQDIDRLVYLSEQPVALPIAEAVTVLRAWGVGINTQRFTRRGRPPQEQQDRWLVVEHCPMWTEILGEPPAPPARVAKAAPKLAPVKSESSA